MIRIKTYTKNKKNGSSSGSSTTQNVINNNVANQWFEYDNDNNAVRCKYDFSTNGTLNGLSQEDIAKLRALAQVMYFDVGGNIRIPSSVIS